MTRLSKNTMRVAALVATFLALLPLTGAAAASASTFSPVASSTFTARAGAGTANNLHISAGQSTLRRATSARRTLFHRSVVISGHAGDLHRFSPKFVSSIRTVTDRTISRVNRKRAVDYGKIVSIRPGEIVVRQQPIFHVAPTLHHARSLFSNPGIAATVLRVRLSSRTLVSVPGAGNRVLRSRGSVAGLRAGSIVAAVGSLAAGGMNAKAIAELNPARVRTVAKAAQLQGRTTTRHLTLYSHPGSKRFYRALDTSGNTQTAQGTFEGCIPDPTCIVNQYTEIQKTYTAPNQEDQGGLTLYDDGVTQIYLQSVGYFLGFDQYVFSWPMTFQATTPPSMYQAQQGTIDMSVQPQQITQGSYTFAGGLGISYAAVFNVKSFGGSFQTSASAGIGVTNTTSDPAPLAGESLDVGPVQCMDLIGLDVKDVVSLASASFCFNVHFDGENVGMRATPTGADLVNYVGNPITSPAQISLSKTPEPLWVIPRQNNWSIGLDNFYWAPKMTLQGYLQVAADPGIGPANVQCSCLTWSSPVLSFPGYPQNIPMIDTIPNDPYAKAQLVHLGGPDGAQTSNITYNYTSPPSPSVLSYSGGTDFKTGNQVGVSATLTDNQSNPIVGAAVKFDLDGRKCTGTTDALGYTSCYIDITGLSAGHYSISGTFDGGDGYAGTSFNFISSLSATSLVMDYVGTTKSEGSKNVFFAVDVAGLDGAISDQSPALATVQVTFYVNGTKMCSTNYTNPDSASWVNANILQLRCYGFPGTPAGPGLINGFAAGAYTITAKMTPTNYYTMDPITSPLTLTLLPTTLSYQGPATIPYHGSLAVSSLLTSPGGHASLFPVLYTLGSGADQQSCQAVLGATGVWDYSTCTLNPINLPPGQYTLTASYPGDPYFAGASTSVPFTVTKGASSLTYTGPSTAAYHQKGIALSATLSQPNSSVNVVGQVVHFALGTQSCDATTNANGEAACEIGQITQDPGATLTVSYAGNDLYTGTSISPNFSITRAATTLTYGGATTGIYDGSLVASATLTEGNSGPAITGQTVSFTLGTGAGEQTCSGVTDAQGNAGCTIDPIDLTPGVTAMTLNFAGDARFQASSTSLPVTLSKADTHLAYTGATTADFGDTATLSGVLRVGADGTGAPVANQPVSFSLGTQGCVATTDARGNATCDVPGVTQAPGSATASATFAGNDDYNGATASSPFTVKQEETSLRYTATQQTVATGQSLTLSAILTDAADASEGETSAAPIAAQTVTLSLGSQSCTGVTQADGTVNCTIGAVNLTDGNQPAGASFAGDSSYLASNDTGHQILVYSFLSSGGSFLLGDQTVAAATSSSTVTFWGHSWASDNSLSGGAASSSFKGYAEAAGGTAVTCGSTWSSSGGNSSSPPSEIPAYMAVAVTSAAGKSGRDISGTITKVVVVKTNPGYGPNPGHEGTGSVVATLCG
ncbi:MAG: hypothetical protein ACRDFX_06430 [Chloroflexota bacterium]